MIRLAILLTCASLAACTGTIGDSVAAGDDDDDITPPGQPDAAPVDECAAAGIDELGACTGAGELSRCIDGHVVVDTCATGGGCFVLAGTPGCVDASECSGVGPAGRCQGDTLWRCDGALAITDCTAAGQVCGFAGDQTGYACLETAGAGARRLTGTVRFEKPAITKDGLGDVTPVPVRGAAVAVVRDSNDQVLARAASSDDGSYTLRYDAADGESVHLSLATGSSLPARPFQVRKNNNALHGFAGESLAAADDATSDLLLLRSSTATQALNVFDGTVRGFDALRAHGVTDLRELDVYFQSGSGSGSYYDGTLNLAGVTSDSDGWDDMVILHEFGHYVQDAYAVSDNPGGAHDGSPADPRLAWGEGEATYFAMAVSGITYYADSDPSGGWHVELENRVHKASAGGSMSQYVSEWMVAELMWDVGDAASDADADAFTDGDHGQALALTWGYMRQSSSDRGTGGVDLVDWLDAWFASYGNATCAAMAQLLGTYGFPYDFAGPGSTCP